ncbi:MAG: LuxE/PaaK family acyltransferase, partial [Mucilaginibacter sp.]
MIKPDKQQVFSINNEQRFRDTALQIFRFQAKNCTVYNEFITNLKVDFNTVDQINDIPFLPISFFKSHEVISTADDVQMTFTSSGTTGTINSKHLVTDISWYEESFRRAFDLFYG